MKINKPNFLFDWTDFERVFSNTRVLIAVSGIKSQKNANVLSELLLNFTSCRAQIDLVYCPVPMATISGRRFIYNRTDESRNVRQLLEEISRNCDTSFNIFESSMQLADFDTVAQPDLSEIDEELLRSIRSVWMSQNLKSLNFKVTGKVETKLLKLNLAQYEFGKASVLKQYSVEEYDFVLVPNGRWPWEVGMKHGAELRKSKIMYYENGTRERESVFIEPFQTQDIESMNKYFKELIGRLDKSQQIEAISWASAWLKRQKSDPNLNPFVFLDVSKQVTPIPRSKKRFLESSSLVPIFTSSIDERFSNLAMNFNGWQSQIDGIISISQRLVDTGRIPYVRIHPNAGWKSASELIEIIRKCKDNNIDFQLPWHGPNTYELISRAQMIITWGSTVSLESTAIGIPTFNLGRTRYDCSIDVQIVSKESLSKIDFAKTNDVDPRKTLIAIYITRHWGIEPRFSDLHPTFDVEMRSSGYRKRMAFYLALENFVFRPVSFVPNHIYFPIRKLLGDNLASIITLIMIRIVAIRV